MPATPRAVRRPRGRRLGQALPPRPRLPRPLLPFPRRGSRCETRASRSALVCRPRLAPAASTRPAPPPPARSGRPATSHARGRATSVARSVCISPFCKDPSLCPGRPRPVVRPGHSSSPVGSLSHVDRSLPCAEFQIHAGGVSAGCDLSRFIAGSPYTNGTVRYLKFTGVARHRRADFAGGPGHAPRLAAPADGDRGVLSPRAGPAFADLLNSLEMIQQKVYSTTSHENNAFKKSPFSIILRLPILLGKRRYLYLYGLDSPVSPELSRKLGPGHPWVTRCNETLTSCSFPSCLASCPLALPSALLKWGLLHPLQVQGHIHSQSVVFEENI